VTGLVAGAVALAATIAVRGATANRLIRGKLRLSLTVFAVYLAFQAVLAAGGAADPSFRERLQWAVHLAQLLLALGGLNLLVVLAVNPWRVDRVPEHFPSIVQDAMVIGAFLLVATGVMGEKFLTTSAVGAVVIGFALQDTLGNTFAGLAIQVEKPFRAGHWIKVAGFEGIVTEITWRATRLRTKSGDNVILPNSLLSKEAIVNYSEPALPTRQSVEVGASYDAPPNRVKAVILDAIRDARLVLATPPPEVVVADFGSSAIVYRVKFWIADFAVDDPARDQVRTCVYYAFRRAGIEIPYPIQVEYRGTKPASPAATAEVVADALAGTALFGPLLPGDRESLAAVAVPRVYGSGQTIVREGDEGDSMFVVMRGKVRVTVGEAGREVAAIGPAGYFGEMSLLTGDPRTATVAATEDCLLLEIGADDFRRLALAHPSVVEHISSAVAERRLGLERSRAVVAEEGAPADAPRSFLARVQQWLGLPGRGAST
jgi:small-conductance mechanosensitive channel/CRP-like cAMP-binding protein